MDSKKFKVINSRFVSERKKSEVPVGVGPNKKSNFLIAKLNLDHRTLVADIDPLPECCVIKSPFLSYNFMCELYGFGKKEKKFSCALNANK